MVASGSVTVLSHPSLQGISSGSGISGSTTRHGVFRFCQYLKGIKPSNREQPDGDLRELAFKKNQYGPTGETIVLHYHRRLFLPEGSMTIDKLAREQKADEIFLTLLARYDREGRNVSDKSTSPNYASAMFCKEKKPPAYEKKNSLPPCGTYLQTAKSMSKTTGGLRGQRRGFVRTRRASGVTRPQHAARIY